MQKLAEGRGLISRALEEDLRKVNESIEEVLSKLTLWDISSDEPVTPLVALESKHLERV